MLPPNFTFPLTAVFGISYRPTPKWNLEFDANYTDWSSFGTVTIKQSPPASNIRRFIKHPGEPGLAGELDVSSSA